VVAAHHSVAECAVIGIHDELRGQVPVALAVLKDGSGGDELVFEKAVVELVRDQVGALANLKQVLVVKRLPKTRSGKILRAVLRAIADGQEYTVPSTIDDPMALDEIGADMQRRKVGVFAGN
jgi:propionyl-CoA synthetase